MSSISIWVERPRQRTLSITTRTSPDGHEVPELTRANVAQLLFWLWEFDPEAGPEYGGATIPYLLDDLMELLGGGVFAVAYPTDHGKSTLVDADTVISLLLWPEETLNIIIKAAKETAVAAAQACAFKLQRASEYFPYARPLCRWDVQTGLPQVKNGYFIEGCRLRVLGERNRSVYPAGIAEKAVQGMRGRAKLDDLENENTLRSEAATETLRKHVNNSVRNLQKTSGGVVPLWAIFGTPQGANSVMHVVDADLSSSGLRFRSIRRPRVIQDGPHAGQLLFPSTDTKRQMQQGIMDPTAYAIAWELRVPGEGRFEAETAIVQLKDRRFPLLRNEQEVREYLYGRLVEEGHKQVEVGASHSNQVYREAERVVREELALYIGWDPATVGTFALNAIAMLPRTRWLLRLRIDSATSAEQVEQIQQWLVLFPDADVVVERDGQQDAFIDFLRSEEPSVMIVPHTTHGYNKGTRFVGIPSMMAEMQRGVWHFPWVPEDYCKEYLEAILTEIRRWGPISHPHGIPSLWFPWYYDKTTRMGGGTLEEQEQEQAFMADAGVEVYDFVVQSGDGLLRDVHRTPAPQQSASQESWNRRWPSLRRP